MIGIERLEVNMSSTLKLTRITTYENVKLYKKNVNNINNRDYVLPCCPGNQHKNEINRMNTISIFFLNDCIIKIDQYNFLSVYVLGYQNYMLKIKKIYI